jgi:hypothetical protein
MINIKIVDIDMILGGKEKDKKIELLSWLWDCFESYALIDNVESVVNLLINYAISEKDLEIKEEILDTIQIATIYRDVKACKLYLLEHHIDIFSDNMILIIIAIFESTYDERYINILEKLSNNLNENISKGAKEAIEEIKCNVD